VGSGLLVVLFFRFAFPRLGLLVQGPYLNASLQDSRADSDLVIGVHVGDKGTVVTALRPSGKIAVGGEHYDCVADGEFIDKNTPVVISQINGTRITVTREQQ
jgi:membrane-bound serine protease (ClpP class)